MSDVIGKAWQTAMFDVAIYPLTWARTLIELGYEPFPLERSNFKILCGCRTLFLPNFYSYIYKSAEKDGIMVLYRGVEACALRTFVFILVTDSVFKYIRKYLPNLGGEPVRPCVKEHELTTYESFRRRFRTLIRQTAIQTIAVVATQPFLVCMVREVAQHIGKETLYGPVHVTLMKIADSEGIPGLFSGIIPTLLASYFCNWGLGAVGFVLDRFVWPKMKMFDPADPLSVLRPKSLATIALDKFVIQPGGQRYRNVSRMMCVAGTGLKVSNPPFAIPFCHWTDAFKFLRQEHQLGRGNSSFFRVHYGAIYTCPTTKHLFATTSLHN